MKLNTATTARGADGKGRTDQRRDYAPENPDRAGAVDSGCLLEFDRQGEQEMADEEPSSSRSSDVMHATLSDRMPCADRWSQEKTPIHQIYVIDIGTD